MLPAKQKYLAASFAALAWGLLAAPWALAVSGTGCGSGIGACGVMSGNAIDFCTYHTKRLPCEFKCPCGTHPEIDPSKMDIDGGCPILDILYHNVPAGGGGGGGGVKPPLDNFVSQISNLKDGLSLSPGSTTPDNPGNNNGNGPGGGNGNGNGGGQKGGQSLNFATAGEKDSNKPTNAPPRVLALPGIGSASGSSGTGSSATAGNKGDGSTSGSLLGSGFGSGNGAGKGEGDDKNGGGATTAQGAPGSDAFGSGGGGRGGGGSSYGRGTGDVGTGGNSVTLYQNPAAGANDSIFDLISKRYQEFGKEL